MTLKNKKILLIIGGGISAYKSLDLIRLLKKNNFEIKTVLTKSGKKFVTPLSLISLSGGKVYEDLFDNEKGVLIMSEDLKIRENRLNLLSLIRNYSLKIADFTLLNS